MNAVSDNYKKIREQIERACEKSGRNATDIQIIAVTKYATVERMKEAFDSGLVHFGENRYQDAKEKLNVFPNATWHFIGHLQTNKVKDVVPRFSFIHSLDRGRLADEIARVAYKAEIRPKCFVQVNISGEETKYGIPPEELDQLVKTIRDSNQIDLVGLMTMAPHLEDLEETRPIFRKLRELREKLLEMDWQGEKPLFLSMGMSNDYAIAVEEGATHVRIGQALLGK